MEITPLQRRITFGLIVFVLVALGAYLIGPAARGSGSGGRPVSGPHLTPAANPSAARSSQPSAAQPAGGGIPDIYQWLPFTQAEFGAAAAAAQQFGTAYGTFSYAETPAGYVARLAPVTSAQLAAQLKAAYSLPGVAAARSSSREVSAGTAVIQSLRAFGPGSLTFVVQIAQNLTTAKGRNQQVTSYAITLSGSASNWQVTDIELAAAGNS